MTNQPQETKKGMRPETKAKLMEIVRYCIIGLFTTVLNWGCSIFFEEVCHMWAWLNTALSWIISIVLFAFWAYKVFVFQSKSLKKEIVIREFIAFCAARLATLFIEMAIMGIFVDLLGFSNTIHFGLTRFEVVDKVVTDSVIGKFGFSISEFYIAKFFATVVITILNYVFSKVFIFKGPTSDDKEPKPEEPVNDEPIPLDQPVQHFDTPVEEIPTQEPVEEPVQEPQE